MWNIDFESPENIPKCKCKHCLISKSREGFFFKQWWNQSISLSIFESRTWQKLYSSRRQSLYFLITIHYRLHKFYFGEAKGQLLWLNFLKTWQILILLLLFLKNFFLNQCVKRTSNFSSIFPSLSSANFIIRISWIYGIDLEPEAEEIRCHKLLSLKHVHI